jgi:hypothetical protein
LVTDAENQRQTVVFRSCDTPLAVRLHKSTSS